MPGWNSKDRMSLFILCECDFVSIYIDISYTWILYVVRLIESSYIHNIDIKCNHGQSQKLTVENTAHSPVAESNAEMMILWILPVCYDARSSKQFLNQSGNSLNTAHYLYYPFLCEQDCNKVHENNKVAYRLSRQTREPSGLIPFVTPVKTDYKKTDSINQSPRKVSGESTWHEGTGRFLRTNMWTSDYTVTKMAVDE